MAFIVLLSLIISIILFIDVPEAIPRRLRNKGEHHSALDPGLGSPSSLHSHLTEKLNNINKKDMNARRDKAQRPSGCKSHPAKFDRSSRKLSERRWR